MDHAEALALIEPYVDGELDRQRAEAFETHIASCAQCRARLDAWHGERRAVAEALDIGSAPAGLADRIRAATIAKRGRPVVLPAWSAQAAALVGVAILSSAATVGALRLRPADDRAQTLRVQTLFDAHMRAEDPGRMIEVASSDQHTVKPWLDARLDFAPPVRDLTAEGFPLVGGRLDYVEGRRAAVLVYGRRKHLIDVFIRPSGDAPAPPKTADRRGFHLVGWCQGGFDWWAVSDVDAKELTALHHLLERPPADAGR
jgi:anti-sigma factor RsiW